MRHARTSEDRFACIEHVVESRLQALDYLLAFHTLVHPPATSKGSGQALGGAVAGRTPLRQHAVWMDTVAIGRADMERYFERHHNYPVDASPPGAVGSSADPANSRGGLRALASGHKYERASDAWLERHVNRWFALGYGLANLLVASSMTSGALFIAAAHELLLELDHAAAEGHGARRALAIRALKNDREDRGVLHARPAPNVAYVYHLSPAVNRPSYLRTMASLLPTLSLIYRKLVDTETARDSTAYHRFCKFDEFVETNVIHVVAKELSHLAKSKLASDADRLIAGVAFVEPDLASASPGTTSVATSAASIAPSTGHQPASQPSKKGGKGGWKSWFGGGNTAASEAPAEPTTPPLAPMRHMRNDSLDGSASLATTPSVGGR